MSNLALLEVFTKILLLYIKTLMFTEEIFYRCGARNSLMQGLRSLIGGLSSGTGVTENLPFSNIAPRG